MSDNDTALYDEKIAPLMAQIIEISLAAGIPMYASYYLGVDERGSLFCTTVLPGKWAPDSFRAMQEIIGLKAKKGAIEPS